MSNFSKKLDSWNSSIKDTFWDRLGVRNNPLFGEKQKPNSATILVTSSNGKDALVPSVDQKSRSASVGREESAVVEKSGKTFKSSAARVSFISLIVNTLSVVSQRVRSSVCQPFFACFQKVLTKSKLFEKLNGIWLKYFYDDFSDLDDHLAGADEEHHELCQIKASPYRIIRAAENGNLKEFDRLHSQDPTRIEYRDAKGRSAIHLAASKNRVNILQYIYDHYLDINDKDGMGNTPLHAAIDHEALDSIVFLIEHDGDLCHLNDRHQSPLHLATELNRQLALQTMAKFSGKIDVSLGGEHGRTALHLSAIYDHDQCAQILLKDFGANLRQTCNNGFYPIHEAAKNAASRTMDIFMKWGETTGCSRHEMLGFFDSEGCVPLHSAVHSGDIKAVELCLRSGAKISMQQHDMSTPVHLACAQGAGDIIKTMFEHQPQEKSKCLATNDAQQMTPLHCAAMFDHPDIVEYLVKEYLPEFIRNGSKSHKIATHSEKQGADIKAVDKDRRTPMLLAASRSSWRSVETLIELGSDVKHRDGTKRNLCHMIVMHGGRLDEFAQRIAKAGKMVLLDMMNDKDQDGNTPMHYASREGHISSLSNLISLGAIINPKNVNKETPLHYGSRYGRYNSVRLLLDSEKGPFIINECDGEGLTPLHISSLEGHTKLAQLFLTRGALLHRDHMGRTPLHLAALRGYTDTMELILSVHSHLLDQIDKEGSTALHLAAMENRPNAICLLLSIGCKLLHNKQQLTAIDYAVQYKYVDAALAMVTHAQRGEEVRALKSEKHPSVIMALIGSMPKVVESVLDACIIKADCKKDSKMYFIKYSFDSLQMGLQQIRSVRKRMNRQNWRPEPLNTMNTMVAHGRVELLAHPLSQKYLQMKWNAYGKYFHMANLLIYVIFLSFITGFAAELMAVHETNWQAIAGNINKGAQVPYAKGQHEIVTQSSAGNSSIFGDDFPNEFQSSALELDAMTYVSGIGVMIFVFTNMIKEMLQFYHKGISYLFNVTNVLTWILYICSTIMVSSVFTGMVTNFQFSSASVAVFMTWFNLLLHLQRFDRVGIYVVMFLEILQTLLKVLLVFSILIIAFGLAFYILMSHGHHMAFGNVPMSLIRTFSMMLGEIDFLGTYVLPYYHASSTRIYFPGPTFLILSIFMVFMPILLMNLLIGLAVGDIEAVRRNAQLKRLAMQVELHTELERKLPHFFLDRVDKMEIVDFPNEKETHKEVGAIGKLLRKVMGTPFKNEVDDAEKTIEDLMMEDITKQKKKLREIASSLETQQRLLRLMVQKLEIKSDTEEVDEGVKKESGTKWQQNNQKLRSVMTMGGKAA